MVLAVFVRRLRERKTYADFREAWRAEKGFGVPARVVSRSGSSTSRPTTLRAGFERVGDQEQVRHGRVDEVIEPGMTRTFFVQVGDDDLS